MTIIATISIKQLKTAIFENLKKNGVKFTDGEPNVSDSEYEIAIEALNKKVVLTSDTSEQQISITNLPGYEFSEGKVVAPMKKLLAFINMYDGGPKLVRIVETGDDIKLWIRWQDGDERVFFSFKTL